MVSNGDGWGSRSLVISQVTKDGRPSAPIALTNTSRNDTCITVEWRPPATANGIITSYKVYQPSTIGTISFRPTGIVHLIDWISLLLGLMRSLPEGYNKHLISEWWHKHGSSRSM